MQTGGMKIFMYLQIV